MSSGSQHKMYNYELNPPSGIWEKIAAELEESELSAKFPATLRTIQIAPPAQAWQQIAAVLDESALVNDYSAKLAGIEVLPPAFAWQHIAAELDETVLVNDYSTKLAGIEVTPPPAAWSKINTSLHAEQESELPQRRRIAPFLKYAAAAALIGFLAWGGTRLLNNKPGDNSLAQEKSEQKENRTTSSVSSALGKADEDMALPDIAASMEEARNDAALEASKKTFAKLDPAATRSKIKNAANFLFVADDDDPPLTRGFSEEALENPSMDVSNRYVMLMTPQGNIIRVSKKLRELVCCVSGELEDKDCVDQMKKWRDILANPSINHSSNSFIDLLSLMDCMQEN